MTHSNANDVENKTREELEAELIAKALQDEAFKQELLSNPKAVFAQELGASIPDNVEIKVVEETPNTIYLVLPMNSEQLADDKLSIDALETVAGGVMLDDCVPDWRKWIKKTPFKKPLLDSNSIL